MNSTLYSQIIHLLAIVVVGVLVGISKLDVTTGVGAIGLLVGIALPTPGPLVASSPSTSTKGVVAA